MRGFKPNLFLARSGRPGPAGLRQVPGNWGGIQVAADGSFEIRDVPAGSWWVWFRHSGRVQHKLQEVKDLGDGETRRIEVDISALRRTRLSGRALFNGEPLADTRLNFAPVQVTTGNLGGSTQTGPDGSYQVELSPDSYRVSIVVAGGVTVWIGSPATVARLRTQQADLRFQSGRLDVRLLATDGRTPLAGLNLACLMKDPPTAVAVPHSDKEGRVRKDVFPLGTYVLKVWPKHLESRKAQERFQAEHGYPSLLHSLVTVGEFTVVPGTAATQDMIVPAEAGY